MDVETAAAELDIPIEVVSEAVRNGAIPVLRIAGFERISRDVLIEMSLARDWSAAPPASDAGVRDATSPRESVVPAPKGLAWTKELEPGPGFTHNWPQKREDYGTGKNVEEYVQSWEGEIVLDGRATTVKIGRGTRLERGRLTAFFDGSPLCEFAETLDGQHWASIVKPNGSKVLFPGQPIPGFYRGTQLEAYRGVTGLSGTGVPKGLAVVIGLDDMRSAVHHAAARRLGKRGLAVEAQR